MMNSYFHSPCMLYTKTILSDDKTSSLKLSFAIDFVVNTQFIQFRKQFSACSYFSLYTQKCQA